MTTGRASRRREKYAAMIAVLAGSGLALLASTQNWSTLHLTTTADHSALVTVQGSSAAPALTALALAGLALVAALAIAGRIARVVLGVLGLLIGAGLLLSSLGAIGDPVQAGSSAVTAATGVAGERSVAHLVEHTDASFWPWLAVAGGVLLIVAGLLVLATSSRWPGPSRRYRAARFEPAADGGPSPAPSEAPESDAENTRDAAIDSWDELSRGEDPTR